MISKEGLAHLKRHEGYRKYMYKDTEGYTTIGYGLNLDAGMDEELASFIVEFLANRIYEQCLIEFRWFKSLTQRRKDVIVNMIFNLGLDGFKKFRKTIYKLDNSDFDGAATEMLDSEWARQVGLRARFLADQMRKG
jgi:lysozyme